MVRHRLRCAGSLTVVLGDLIGLRVKSKPHASYGLDESRVTAGLAELVSKVSDVHVEQMPVAVPIEAPDRFDELLSGEHSAGCVCQAAKEIELGASEFNRLAV